MNRRRPMSLVALLCLLVTASPLSATGTTENEPIVPIARAAAEPSGLAATRIFSTPGDTFDFEHVITYVDGSKSVQFGRRHLGLRVVGDSVKLLFSAAGELKYARSELKRPIDIPTITPEASPAAADAAALARFPYRHGSVSTHAVPVIYVDGTGTAALAWEVRIDGRRPDGTPSEMLTYVSSDAKRSLGTDDLVHTVMGP